MTGSLGRLTSALAGRYTIQRELGAGGMATVYLAQDVRHDRQVAIKVLHPELAAALGSDRFLSEIKTTARLQHPHILPLLDSGEADGLLFYVMPFVPGETLRTRLDRERQLPITDALRIAREVADALSDAHAHRIVHRDIKPENILLQGGHALVADFGIALAVQQAGGQRMTQTGLSLGTPQYMAPEQAMGEKTVDHRADIYALAVVLYEMLVGEPPFTGATIQAIIAKVITDAPRPPTQLRRSVPEYVDTAVLQALEKLPADRFESAIDFSRALRSDDTGTHARTANVRGRDAPRRRAVRYSVFLALGAAALVAIAMAVWQWKAAPRPPTDAVVRFTLDIPTDISVTTRAMTGSSVAITPDGKVVAFLGSSADGTRRLFIRPLDEPLPRALPGTEGASQPFFSPDGRWLAFWSGGRLQKVAMDGSAPQLIANLPDFAGATWSKRGVIILSHRRRLFTIPATGGALKQLTSADTLQGENEQYYPVALPDGEHVLYSSSGVGGLEGVVIGIASLSTGKSTRLTISGTYALGVALGYIIAANATNSLLAAPFDASAGRVTGEAIPVATSVAVGAGGTAKAALSANGTLVYFAGTHESELVLVRASGPQELVVPDARRFGYPRFSPDGKRIAITIASGTRSDIWLFDLASRMLTRLTSGGSANERAEWSPDGRHVLYRTDRGDNRSSIWWEPTDLSAPPEPLLAGGARGNYFEGVFSPDGKALVYQIDTSGADVAYRMLKGDTTPRPVANSRYVENMARVSPDGHWVAYVTDESGATQVAVQPFPGPGLPRVQVSVNGGTEPVWGRDRKHLYYRGAKKLVAATYTTSPTFMVTSRSDLFDDTFVRGQSPHANYDVAPNGSQFLMLRGAEQQQLVIVHNWIEELRARISAQAPAR